MLEIKDSIEKVLISEEELQKKVAELGAKISEDYKGKDLVLVGVLKGAVFFMADLVKNIDIHCEIDFMGVSSYGGGTVSTGIVKIIKDLDKSIKGRDVLIVEDILDTGLTLAYLIEHFAVSEPNSIEIVTLLDKPENREKEVKAKYTGFTIPNEFVVGYGLDYDEKYRNIKYIGTLKPEVYSK